MTEYDVRPMYEEQVKKDTITSLHLMVEFLKLDMLTELWQSIRKVNGEINLN